MPYLEPSRPKPDSFTPPNGATSVEMMPVLRPTMPYSSASETRQERPRSRRVEVRGEAELGVVGHADGVRLGLEAEQRRHRAEGFLARHGHLRRDVREHGGLEERAAERMALAAERRPSRLCRRASATCSSTFASAFVIDQRALVGDALQAIADAQLRNRLDELAREGFVHAVLHEQAVGAHAGLAGVAVFAGERALHGGIEIRIVEHDERRVAAELQRQLLQRGRRTAP